MGAREERLDHEGRRGDDRAAEVPAVAADEVERHGGADPDDAHRDAGKEVMGTHEACEAVHA